MYAILPNIIDFFLSKYFSCFRTVCWAASWQPAGPWGEFGPGVCRQISLRTPPSSSCPLPLQNRQSKLRACPCLAESRATSGPAASAGALDLKARKSRAESRGSGGLGVAGKRRAGGPPNTPSEAQMFSSWPRRGAPAPGVRTFMCPGFRGRDYAAGASAATRAFGAAQL